MKKFYFFVAIIIFASLVFVSCVDNTYILAKDNISEIRENILIFKDEDIYVTLMTGKRESNYVNDGISTATKDFAVITLYIIDNQYDYNEQTVSYLTTIDNVDYSGQMLNNPYDNSYVIDLAIALTPNLDNIEVTFVTQDKEYKASLHNISNEWKYDGYDALEIVCKDFKDYIKQAISDNSLQAEVFIKNVYNETYSDDYYWYIQIVTQNGNIYTSIVNPNSGEILARNIK